ncbi:5,10-methylenetetrahydrofolate reductase [Pseudoclavibacter chungangensis]|uniref:Methylenetetrahydrofolate reductase n=1 Tax=Pseudoclavibacter chungangensis TaxID=587635 RepID=A0A7J5BUD9_9MICO|nr:methylenetetrahydrofolate reductase [Pseudoclavibacter chungangensis]KAB1657966.1 5,10-methylenetetrahydrofolate reductase [Pseudoclavibacter chungangensis]NYJ65880.1 methylenetetrahydrofolate reductase (NADPH) [Pseudoclavibacter chungangensis]
MTPPYAGAAARVDPDGAQRIPFSFELFPPRNADVAARMPDIVARLAALRPEFISVTFGAGGSSRSTSLDLLRRIRTTTDITPLAHLTCVGSSYAEATGIIREFLDEGITNFLALRGDPPAGLGEDDEFLGDLRTGAELVQLIHRVRREHVSVTPSLAAGHEEPRWRVGGRPGATVCVAAYPNGHPRSRSIRQDYDALLAKEAAGANLAFTQLFFHADDYLRFVEGARTAGVTMPIVPGLLAVTSTARLRRMAELAGEPIPVGLYRSLERARSVGARREVGIAHATALALDLLDGGAPGIHLYTQNRIDEPTELLARIGAIERGGAGLHADRMPAGTLSRA